MDSTTNEFYMKKVVITGASSGIGACCANYFLNFGAQVILVGRDIEYMKSIGKRFQQNSIIMNCDLVYDNQINDLKDSILKKFESIDILINCAGLKLDSDIEKTYPQDFDYSLNINLRSIFLLIKSLSNNFSENASIVNVSCLYGTRPMQGLISFCISKAGLEAFTRCAAGELASNNVRVNCVSCCPIVSNSLRYAQANEKENALMEEKMKKNVPLGRMAHPSDPAKAIVFLCSKRAESITGQVIKVDGGRNLTSSGYVHYKGYHNMNSRFEPDGEKLLNKLNIFSYFKKDDNNMIKKVENMSEEDLDIFIKKTISESNFSNDLIENYNEEEEDDEENQSSNSNIKKKFEKIKETYEENYEENEKSENNFQNNKENDDITEKDNIFDSNSNIFK